MTQDQLVILLILAGTAGMFLWGRWRHDMVAVYALLACVVAGLLPRNEAFAGFGHPAVITVACVLILSRGLQNSGAIDALAQRILPVSAGPTLTIAALTGLGAVLSAFMNNVGALALLMPVAIQTAAKQKMPPGRVRMPLAFGLLPAAISFAAGVLACMALRVVSPRTVYEAVDWPVIVLLAALIPVAGVMASTGAAELVARLLLENVAQGNAIIGLAVILVVTMTLSDFMNNAATAALMCPIAISTAAHLEARPDSFLMAVAVGASCAFLTPIGHQNNTLILGPGGFHFGDYWKLGLPMEILVVLIAMPLLLLFWPLH